MLSPRLHRQPPSASLLLFLLEPMRTLWPTSQAIFAQAERDLIQTVKDMARAMESMDEFHQNMLRDVSTHNRARSDTLSQVQLARGQADTARKHFALSLSIPGVSGGELTVKLVGGKLLMTGSKETKSDDGDGFVSYKYEVFRRESNLPEDVNPEGLTCFLSNDGQLRIEAPRRTLTAMTERNVPIQLSRAATEAGHEKPAPGERSTDQNKRDDQREESKDQSKRDGHVVQAIA